jgi:hypothetical protein
MEASAKLEAIKLNNRKRQAKFYNENKAKILAKMAIEREQLKILNKVEPIVIVPVSFKLDEMIQIFNTVINENTRRKYVCDIKRVFSVSKIPNFTGSMEEYQIIKESISNSKYAISTQKGCIQSILVFIEKSNIIIDTKVTAKYSVLYEIYNIKTTDQNTARKTDADHNVMEYPAYMELIKEKYGADSKQYLIVSIYNEVSVRDDFARIIVLNDKSQDNNIDNYLLNEDGKYIIILNKYKTSNVYGKQIYNLSNELSLLIQNYIIKHEIDIYLFPENSCGLSGYITNFNKRVNINGAINYIRHMKVSQFLNRTDLTPEERHSQAIRMCHSEETQQKYKRGVTKGVVETILLDSLK